MNLSDENPSDTNMHALKRETQLQIEAGIAEGIGDIEAGRVEEMSDTTTTKRIAQFKARLPQ